MMLILLKRKLIYGKLTPSAFRRNGENRGKREKVLSARFFCYF